MKKVALVLTALLSFVTTSAFAGTNIEVEVGTGAPPASVYRGGAIYVEPAHGARIQSYGMPHRNAQCAPGLRPAGNLGCVGETVTNREDLQTFDRHINHGCIEGAQRTVWANGTDPQGHQVKWEVHQTAHCNNQPGS